VKQADRSGRRKIEPFVERNPVVLPSSAQNVRDEISSHSILFFPVVRARQSRCLTCGRPRTNISPTFDGLTIQDRHRRIKVPTVEFTQPKVPDLNFSRRAFSVFAGSSRAQRERSCVPLPLPDRTGQRQRAVTNKKEDSNCLKRSATSQPAPPPPSPISVRDNAGGTGP
jgi:hypothetical protein